MKLNTDSSCGFKIRTIEECGILQVKTAVKKYYKINQQTVTVHIINPSVLFLYAPWGREACSNRELGVGGLGCEQVKTTTKLSQWPLPKKVP